MIEDYRDLEPIPEHGNDFRADVSNENSIKMKIHKERIASEIQLLINGVYSKAQAVEEIAAYIRWRDKQLNVPAIVGQRKEFSLTQLWKMAQKYNCDDFIKIVKEIESSIPYNNQPQTPNKQEIKQEILDIAKKLYHNHLTPETATNLLWDLVDVERKSEQLVCDVCASTDVIEVPHMGRNCNQCHPL